MISLVSFTMAFRRCRVSTLTLLLIECLLILVSSFQNHPNAFIRHSTPSSVVGGAAQKSHVLYTLPKLVVFGPGPSEMGLLVTKLAARAGIDSTYVCQAGEENGSMIMMYGADDKKPPEGENSASVVASGADIGAALSTTNCLALNCYSEMLQEARLNTALGACGGNLSRVVLLSQMGATLSNGGGFMGLLGGGPGATEKIVKKACDAKGVELSIVRAGALKGGGPGKEELDTELGLSKIYYNSIFELQQAMVTMAHDKFTLGAYVVAGDVPMANGLQQTMNKGSFEPKPNESNRIVVAGAMVAAMLADKPIDISVGCAKGEMPPSLQEWNDILAAV
mmetsp:Transcript_8247/g.14951  ORF Transcript_8247/g.14951 Transcript_8247/m.14951 type:complete len:337 (+) Transcript_8247:24-1034(+)